VREIGGTRLSGEDGDRGHPPKNKQRQRQKKKQILCEDDKQEKQRQQQTQAPFGNDKQ